jgi:hypothetical protein
MNRLLLLPFLAACSLAACGGTSDDDDDDGDDDTSSSGPITDYGDVCVTADLTVVANSRDCSSDHEGVVYACTATLDGTTVTASTQYTPGDDPNDGCAPPVVVSCGLTLPEGSYTIDFGGDSHDADVQAGGSICVPSGEAFDTGG